MKKYSKGDPLGLDEVCEDGLYLGSPDGVQRKGLPKLGFNLRDLDRYAKAHGLKRITAEDIERAKKEGAI